MHSAVYCCCLGAEDQRTSVLDELSCRRFDFIHVATLRIHTLVRSVIGTAEPVYLRIIGVDVRTQSTPLPSNKVSGVVSK